MLNEIISKYSSGILYDDAIFNLASLYENNGEDTPYIFKESPDNIESLYDIIIKSIKTAGYSPGENVFLGLDVASTEFFIDDKYHLN